MTALETAPLAENLQSVVDEFAERLWELAPLDNGTTAEHCERVGKIAAGMAIVAGVPEEDRGLLSVIEAGGRIHDIGKLFLPKEYQKLIFSGKVLNPKEHESVTS